MHRFALIGLSDHEASKHLNAIQETGNFLVASFDRSYSSQKLEDSFPEAVHFKDFDNFDRYLEKLKSSGSGIDYLVICSPNYLHEAHIRFGLKLDADVICENPVVLNPWNINLIQEIEKSAGRIVYSILRFRDLPPIINLKKRISALNISEKLTVKLTWIEPVSDYYYRGWKGDISKSGGIATNIGIHSFDLLNWLFGKEEKIILNLHTHDRASGIICYSKANVKWFLSINADTKPQLNGSDRMKPICILEVDGEMIDLNLDLIPKYMNNYKRIFAGRGYRLDEVKQSIEMAYAIRTSEKVQLSAGSHPLARLPLSKHPFVSE